GSGPRIAGPIDDVLQEPHDGIAGCDEMIVGNAEMERRTDVDGKKTKRVDAPVGVECDVELALDLRVAGGGRISPPGKDAELDGPVAAAPGVPAGTGIELETGETEAFECSVDAALELRHVERLANADGMHGAVGIELAPAQHRSLEQVEPSHSPLLFATLA